MLANEAIQHLLDLKKILSGELFEREEMEVIADDRHHYAAAIDVLLKRIGVDDEQQ